MILRAAALLILSSIFVACGGTYRFPKSNDLSSKLGACDAALIQTFARTYQPLLRTVGCQNCHAAGGLRSDLPFADSDMYAAFSAFKSRGPMRINSRIQEGHQQQVLGYSYSNLQPYLQSYLNEWNTVQASCSIGGAAVMTPGQSSNIFTPADIDDLNKCGVGDPLRTDHLNYQVLTWDLGAIRPDLAGVTLKISVKADSPVNIGGNICAHTGYRAGNVTISTTKALHLNNLQIYLNGSSYNVTTFMIDRNVPANSTDFKLIDSMSGGFGVFNSGSAKAADKWSVYVDRIEVSQ